MSEGNPHSVDFFSAKVAECKRLAEQTTNPKVKESYELLARQWSQIAERAARFKGE